MKCAHCGTECIGSVPACEHDALKAQLASMTKRVEDAERSAESFERDNATQFEYIREGLKAARLHHFGPLDGSRVAHQIEALGKERDAAEAKLATAVEVLKAASVWANSNKVFYHHVGGPGCTGDVLHELGMTALGALRALGIDPSKEQKK